jgi:hypothetical protein
MLITHGIHKLVGLLQDLKTAKEVGTLKDMLIQDVPQSMKAC